MPKKKPTKVDNDRKLEQDIEDDIVLEEDSLGGFNKLKQVQKKLRECEKERQEYLNGWQRARADAVNKDKEVALERAQAISRTETKVFIELFPILDSFDMAFSNKEVWESVDENWRLGIEHIYTQATQVFEQAGISVIDTTGEFDSNVHESVKTEKVESKKDDNRILSVIQKGYQRKDQVLRPAKVIIGEFK